MSRSRGVTLLEVAVVLSIVLVLLALLFPVFARAKESLNAKRSLGRLHQLQVATMIYVYDWDGDGLSHRGLPPRHYVYTTYMDLGEDFFRSPCGYKEIVRNQRELGYQYVWDAHPETVEYFALRQGDSILFTDASCNESREVWESPPAMKRGLGVRLNGNLVDIRRTGMPIWIYWWDP